jgi:hypothetical protein
VNAQVLGGMPGVEPVIALPLLSSDSLGKRDNDSLRNSFDELPDKRGAQAFLVASPAPCPFQTAIRGRHGG